jgi:hypothetical protein
MKPAVGAEIEAWCTSCRLDLNHRVVALVEGAPKKVVCLSCNKTHNYRRPHSAPGAGDGGTGITRATTASASAAKSRSSAGKAGSPAKAAAGKQATARVSAQSLREWEARMAEGPSALLSYSIEKRFAAGQHIVHRKFGAGFVREVLDDHKVNVLFREGVKTLVHDRAEPELAAS